ncbi:MAG: sigma-54-dependent Fis family transcriptional regulator [Planctomycetes bacterium]|nr:sigma-54-dependent Fis family transcriptional regulator [Planctomycetota bacterium]
MESLLVVDDEPAVRQVIIKAFPELRVREASSADQALAAMREEIPDLILLDHRLPDGEGLAIIQRLRAIDQRVPIVMLTGYGSTTLAVECFKRGAADYLEKPFKLDRLQFTVRNLLERHQAQRAGRAAARPALVARSHAMKELLASIKRICSVPSNMPVLIGGEPGTGKELVARVLHERSHRGGRPFAAVACAGLPAEQLDVELFGIERGGEMMKAGAFESAGGGSLYLDEFCELPQATQGKVLRAVEHSLIRRVNGFDDVRIDVRLLAGTSADPRDEVLAGRLRQDLYFRLRVVPLRVPSLRERGDDVLIVAESELARVTRELGRPTLTLSQAAREAIRTYSWPGNIRELMNAIERAVVVAPGPEIMVQDLYLDEKLRPGKPQARETVVLPGSVIIPPGERNLQRIEAMIIRAALEESSGHKSNAADMLGINRTTLYNKLREINPAATHESESSDVVPAVRPMSGLGDAQ